MIIKFGRDADCDTCNQEVAHLVSSKAIFRIPLGIGVWEMMQAVRQEAELKSPSPERR